MSMSDNIADMLTRIRNGQQNKLISTMVPCSKMKCAILDVLKEEGYIKSYVVSENNNNIKQIEIYLKYFSDGKPAIHTIKKVSKPGKRVYSSIAKLKEYYNKLGIYILSTSQGILSEREARSKVVGGEVICKVF